MIKHKLILFALLCICLSNSDSIGQYDKVEKKRFVAKVQSTCSFAGFKLVLLPNGKSKGQVPFSCTYEQDKLFAGYSNNEKMDIISELLSYEGDTTTCSKSVCRYGYTDNKHPNTSSYTIQIDALYLLTTLVVGGYATYYCPYPVLIDTATGEEINDVQGRVAEVYSVYKKWYKENQKTGFKNFNVPLRNCRYAWYGIREGKKYMLKESFKIHQLGGAFSVVGVCLD